MSHRKIRTADFKGKTVASVDASCVNIIRFGFTDGTALAIEVEALGHGIYGMVACDRCAEKRRTSAMGGGDHG